MNGLRVEKEATEATLYLTDGSVERGALFLAPVSPSGRGTQTVPELLREESAVIPFEPEAGGFALVGRAAVAAVAVAPAQSTPDHLTIRTPVQLRLTGGHRLEGAVVGEPGIGERLTDLLRAPDPWMRLERPRDTVWVSKIRLAWLEPKAS